MTSSHNFSEEYIRWNAKLLDYALMNGVDDGRFFLTVRQMLEDESYPIVAEQCFVRSVKTEYITLLKRNMDIFAALRGKADVEGKPLYVAVLGLAVIAAEQMENPAYYKHLAELLEQPEEGGSVRGFSGASFEAAWLELDTYLRRKCGCSLERPLQNALRYVGWPRMHALLRYVDTSKLPDFFIWAGLSPASHVSEREIARLFYDWVDSSYCSLTPSGRVASKNIVSRMGILRQIVKIFETWDGEIIMQEGAWNISPVLRARTAEASLIADVGGSEPRLILCTPRPQGFPERLNVLGVILHASSEEFYDDFRMPRVWSAKLSAGIVVNIEQGKRFRLRGAVAYALADPENQGMYQSQNALRLGVRSGVLCLSAYADKIASYLQNVSRSIPKRTAMISNCEGWTLFHDFIPVKSGVKPLLQLELLTVDRDLLIRPIGGLRLGRAQKWMCGAPPHHIEVIGADPPQEALINGTPHLLTETCEHLFGEPGFYAIAAGGQRYALHITEPILNKAQCAELFHDVRETDELDPDASLPYPHSAPEPYPHSSITPGRKMLCISPAAISSAAVDSAPTIVQWVTGIIEGRLSVIAISLKPIPPKNSVTVSCAWAAQVVNARSARIGVLTKEKVSQHEAARIKATWRAYLATAFAASQRRDNKSRT